MAMTRTQRWSIWGTAIGALGGIGDTLFLRSLGIDFVVAGRDYTVFVMVYLGLTFAVLCAAIGWFLDARARERRDAAIIAEQNRALEESRRVAVQNEKLAAVGRLAAGIAHEVRNPLGVIRASASMIQEDLREDEESFKACQFVCDEIDRLNGLISSLLAFARPSEPRFQRLSVESALDRALQLAAAELRRRNIAVERERAAGRIPEIDADPHLLSQAFLDVVTNSAEALADGGQIALRLRGESDAVEVEIADDGPGVPSEDADRVFEPFFTTKARGTGLGLAMTARIVERHGGDIAVLQGRGAGPDGHGACFRVRFPVRAPIAAPEALS